jgi:hypothetical protein
MHFILMRGAEFGAVTPLMTLISRDMVFYDIVNLNTSRVL